MVFGAEISALSIEFPTRVRENHFWVKEYPDMIAIEEEGAFVRLLASEEQKPADNLFDMERAPYMPDPFRGARERRVLASDEGTLDLEQRALENLFRARGIRASDVDAVMVSSLMPDTFGPQNAAYLTRRLGMTVPAWNFESGCNSSIVGLQNAAALIRAGEYERIAVVVSIASSRMIDPSDTFSWFLGDGAGAFLVERCPEGLGLLGSKVIGTQETCGAFIFPLEVAADKESARVRWRVGEASAGLLMRDNAGPQLRECVHGALERSGHSIDDVDFLVVNTPLAWFATFCAKTLGLSPDQTISTYGSYANVGAVLTPANLFHAAHTGKIKSGDLVVVFGVGSVSTSGALVMRWGDVSLGTPPEPGTPIPSAPTTDAINGEETR